MTVHIDEQSGRRATPTITNCQGLLNSGRRAHYRGNNDNNCNNDPGPPPLHSLRLTPARYSLPLTSSARIDTEHVTLPRIKLDEQPVYEIIARA